ncbi:hypothetical protein Dimus_036310 [Dionaea muscipula]
MHGLRKTLKRKMAREKRKLGLSKKMDEPTKLCRVDGCLVVYNPKDKDLFAWRNAEEAENLLGRVHQHAQNGAGKKALNHEQYIEERDKKLRSQIAKHEKRNKEMKADCL